MATELAIAESPIGSETFGSPGPASFSTEDDRVEAWTNSLAQYLPGDELFSAKFIEGSNLRYLLRGLSKRIIQGDQHAIELLDEFIPDNTTKFLDEWESVLGIPDQCFHGEGTATDRRTAILVKLSALGIQTTADFVATALRFGVVVNVYAGKDVYDTPSLAPGVTFTTLKRARYSIVVTHTLAAGHAFPYTYPIPFGTASIIQLQCLFNNAKPANCQVIFQNV